MKTIAINVFAIALPVASITGLVLLVVTDHPGWYWLFAIPLAILMAG